MNVTCYGSLAASIGREVALDVPSDVTDVAALRGWLAAAYPDAAGDLLRPGTRAVIADRIVGDDTALDGVAAIELLPPVSGG